MWRAGCGVVGWVKVEWGKDGVSVFGDGGAWLGVGGWLVWCGTVLWWLAVVVGRCGWG